MNNLDKIKAGEKTGLLTVVAAIAVGIVSAEAKRKKALDKSIEDAAYERSLKDYESLPGFLKLFKKKPER